MSNNFPLPFGGGNREKLSTKEYVVGIVAILLVFGGIVLYVIEFRHFSNTFGVKSLILWALLLGAIIGIGLGYYFSKEISDSLERLKIYIFCTVLTTLLMPLLGGLSNRYFSLEKPKTINVELFDQKVFGQSRFGNVEGQIQKDGYYLFIVKDQKIERLKTKDLVFLDAQKGDTIAIQVKKGFWGYDIFLE
ncbi:MAG: hypothetical protein AAF573_03285 [Bacteroidota bacterium]